MKLDERRESNPRVLDVGNCSFDHGNISQVLTKHFGADVQAAATGDEAFRAICDGQFDLVLINRVFDANGESGLDLIKRLKAHEETKGTPVMLISNYPDAQEAANALGARPGFGKNSLTQRQTRELLATALSAVGVRPLGGPT